MGTSIHTAEVKQMQMISTHKNLHQLVYMKDEDLKYHLYNNMYMYIMDIESQHEIASKLIAFQINNTS